MMEEIWKDIKGYEGLYQVSNLGRVKSVERKVNANIRNVKERTIKSKILKLIKDDDGCIYANLRKSNKYLKKSISKLVAQAFIPNYEGKGHIVHLDNNLENNTVDNLKNVVGRTKKSRKEYQRKYYKLNSKKLIDKQKKKYVKKADIIKERVKTVNDNSRIYATKHRELWEQKDIEYLLKCTFCVKDKEIAKKLGRTVQAVVAKRCNLLKVGLKSKKRQHK